jgi:hypothetical protein
MILFSVQSSIESGEDLGRASSAGSLTFIKDRAALLHEQYARIVLLITHDSVSVKRAGEWGNKDTGTATSRERCYRKVHS